MSTISQQISEEIKTAMRAKDQLSLNALRALKAAITNFSIEKGGLGTELTDSEEVALVRKQIKQREDSEEQFTKAGRAELAEKERAEIAVLAKFLPAAMSAEEIEAVVVATISELGATSKADMGKVMKATQEKTAGRVDGKTISQLVAKHLS